MKIDYFFELLEKANEFKGIVGETLKTRVFVSLNDNSLGTVQTLEQFWNIVDANKEVIAESEIQKTSSLREFKIIFTNGEEKNIIKLYVE